MLSHLETFFKTYNELAGKKFNVKQHLDAAAAAELIKNGRSATYK